MQCSLLYFDSYDIAKIDISVKNLPKCSSTVIWPNCAQNFDGAFETISYCLGQILSTFCTTFIMTSLIYLNLIVLKNLPKCFSNFAPEGNTAGMVVLQNMGTGKV